MQCRLILTSPLTPHYKTSWPSLYEKLMLSEELEHQSSSFKFLLKMGIIRQSFLDCSLLRLLDNIDLCREVWGVWLTFITQLLLSIQIGEEIATLEFYLATTSINFVTFTFPVIFPKPTTDKFLPGPLEILSRLCIPINGSKGILHSNWNWQKVIF